MLDSMRVRDWMTSPVISVSPGTPISVAHQMMRNHHVRRLPVIEHDQLVGIVTLGDVREAKPSDVTSLSIWELNYLWSQLTVERVMTRGVTTISADAPISEAAELMYLNKISGLPVIENGRVIGILTESDIFKMVAQQLKPVPEPQV